MKNVKNYKAWQSMVKSEKLQSSFVLNMTMFFAGWTKGNVKAKVWKIMFQQCN